LPVTIIRSWFKEDRVAHNGVFRAGALLRIVAVLTFALATVMASSGSASAQSPYMQAQKTMSTASNDAHGAATAAVPNATIDGCPFEWFCAYPSTNFGGTPIKMFKCNVDVFIPFVGSGSWINNQTTGTRAKMKDINHNVIFTTPGAFSADASGDWTLVYYVQAC
jgi:hypothetical protein